MSKTFALEAVGKLQEIVKGLASRNRGHDQFCITLSSHLLIINLWLKDHAGDTDQVKITNILSLLQDICEETSTRVVYNGKTLLEKYPALAKLLKNSSKARSRLQNLSSHTGTETEKERRKKKRISLNKKLESLTSTIDSTTSTGVVEPRVSKNDEVDFSGHINELYGVLSQYSICKVESEAHIIPKIRLNGYRRHDQSGSVFHVLFRDHPHREGSGVLCQWQDAVIHISPKVMFKDDNVQETATNQIEYHEFCGVISRRLQSQLFLTVSRKEAKFRQSPCPNICNEPVVWEATSCSLSLRKILASGELRSPFSNKMKCILYYLLVKGVWQFYDSKLMLNEWTKDSVEFLFEYRQRRDTWTMGVFLNEPVISAKFSPIPLQDATISLSHRFPKIKELGIMLIEILLGKEIDSYRKEFPQWLPNGHLTPHTDLRIANWLYEHNIKNDGEIVRPIKEVIENCLNDQSFKPSAKQRGNPDYLRGVMYERLVRPLESWVDMYENRNDLQPLFESCIKSQVEIRARDQSTTNREQEIQNPPIQIEGSSMLQGADQSSSEIWFKKVDKLNGLLRALTAERDAEYDRQRVKIAVVDTGISPQDLYSQYMKEGMYKDFVDGEDTVKRDDVGHGTNTVNLIFKVFEFPDIFVARVFKTTLASDDTPRFVKQAILWAGEEKKVDIIVMPLGFSQWHEVIREAIDAIDKRIIIFAAAANWGGLDQVAFPARMKDVLCLFSTNPLNKSSRDLNPPLNPRKAHNFAILGEGVQIPASLGSPSRVINGTSISTAIAAGLAGSLLDFSRQPICRDCLRNVKGRDEISAIFEDLSKDYLDGGYNCIAPWSLLRNIRADNREKQRMEIRDHLLWVLQEYFKGCS